MCKIRFKEFTIIYRPSIKAAYNRKNELRLTSKTLTAIENKLKSDKDNVTLNNDRKKKKILDISGKGGGVTSDLGGGPRVVVSTAAYHARIWG